MKIYTSLLLLLISTLLLSCNKDKDRVEPANTIVSEHGLTIELEWNTGGSTSNALYDSDLDLYLDLGESNAEASNSTTYFEEVMLKDHYKDGIYDIYIGAVEVSRRTDYSLFISAPDNTTIHHYTGYLLAGETGELRYMRIQKQGQRYTLLDL